MNNDSDWLDATDDERIKVTYAELAEADRGPVCEDDWSDDEGAGPDDWKAAYGPWLPIAYCLSCGSRLTFEPVYFDRWPRASTKGWRCHCEGCVDGEYVGDPPRLQMSVRSGEGDSPWEALDDCAAMQWDCEPEELLEPKS